MDEPQNKNAGRAEALSDGVFDIIITLLVLELKLPEGEPGQLLSGVLQQWGTYPAYVTPYLYVAVVWLNHNLARFAKPPTARHSRLLKRKSVAAKHNGTHDVSALFDRRLLIWFS